MVLSAFVAAKVVVKPALWMMPTPSAKVAPAGKVMVWAAVGARRQE